MRDIPAFAAAFILAGAASSSAALARPSCGTVEVVFANGRPHNVQAGDAKLYVRVDKRSWTGDGRGLMVPVHIAPGERRREDVPWPPGLDISGVVVDDPGIPIPGAYLGTSSQDRERWAAEGAIETRADDRGRFTFRHLAYGTRDLMAGRDVLYGTNITVLTGTNDVRMVLPTRGKR